MELLSSPQRGITIGDYNADNIVIFPQTSTAKFIDVDSFQLTIHRSNKRILCPCTVGVPEFMAPEIARRLKKEKTDLENVDQDADNPVFNKYTDLYAMAYHIFALLMNGSSPFASMANMEEISQHPSKNVSSIDIDQFHAAEKGNSCLHVIYFSKKHRSMHQNTKCFLQNCGSYLNALLLRERKIRKCVQKQKNFMMH